MKKRRRWKRSDFQEAQKDNDAIPDGLGLGLGIHEERDPDGQLFIYLQFQPTLYIVLGKYMADRPEPYYVADYTHTGPWVTHEGNQGQVVTTHEHLLMAIAKVHELIEDFERRKK